MTKAIQIILYSITLLCLYIIFSVGLELLPKLGISKNSVNINQVSINLSYSYIAGLIFYFFISYLPYILNKQKLKATIDLKIDDITNQIFSYIQTFEKEEINIDMENINLNSMKLLLKNKDILESSYYSRIMAIRMNNLEFINSTKSSIFNLIDSIIIYKEYLDSEQILSLEKIKDSKFFHLLKINHNNQLGNTYYNSEVFKSEFINELNGIFIQLKSLKK